MHFIISSIVFFLISTSANAIQNINVTQGHFDPIPIAINDFASEGLDLEMAKNIVEVITNDLKSSGLFHPISKAAFIENKKGVEHVPLFVAWKQIESTLLVNGAVKKLSSNRIEVSFILWDIIASKDIVGETLELRDKKLWRRAAHTIADKIYERVTGDKGYFNTKIAYISETGSSIKRVKRLAIMDQDGHGHAFLTDGKDLVLTPRFSPKTDKILYLSYAGRKPRVHMRDLRTGKDVVVGHFSGISFSPKFSPDGTKALISLAKNGATNILELDFATMKVRQLTTGSAISTSPSYSPDGKFIVFNSDRDGTRQLYVMNSNGLNIQRISSGSGAYASPVWSPRGDYIAFTNQGVYGFSIGVMRPDGSGERILTNGYLVESPTWAPNGRVVMFTRSSKAPKGSNADKTKIYAIDLTGYNEREIKTPKDASGPEWSRPLQ